MVLKAFIQQEEAKNTSPGSFKKKNPSCFEQESKTDAKAERQLDMECLHNLDDLP